MDVSFVPLSHSREELQAVSGILSEARGLTVRSYGGARAREDVMKSIQDPPRVLHIVTHPFFCESSGIDLYRVLKNPLLLSGLALAGANHRKDINWIGVDPVEDGVLTSLEISALNFANTELVVLSACETGTGFVRNGEGVFGLRRAFHLAGARTILMSMWKIRDRGTCEFMGRFYSGWSEGLSKSAALRRAVMETITSLRSEHGVAHPFFWAPFVLVGDPG
jgi:CHAT domain-containing protein